MGKEARGAGRPPKSWYEKKDNQAMALFAGRVGITIALGVAIPAFCLALTGYASELFKADYLVLAGLCAGCGFCVLFISLPHCARSANLITGAGMMESWAIAILFDVSICVAECVQCFAGELGLSVHLLIYTLAAFSAVFNVVAFLTPKEVIDGSGGANSADSIRGMAGTDRGDRSGREVGEIAA